MSTAIEWLASPVDERSHVFGNKAARTARATCRHMAPADELTEPTIDNAKCLACLTFHGREIAEQWGRSDDRGSVWSPFEVDGTPPT